MPTTTSTGVPVKSVAGHVLTGRAVPCHDESLLALPVVHGDQLVVQYVRQWRHLKRGCKRKYTTTRKLRIVTCYRDNLENGDFRWCYANESIVKL